MSGRIYNWIANGALALGIASAFLYDSTKVPHVLAVAAGIVAGITAVTLYFWNQQECKKKENKEAQEFVVEIAPKLEAAQKHADIGATLAKGLTQTATLDLQNHILTKLTQVTPDVIYFHAHGNASRKWMANYYVHQGHSYGRSLRYAFPKETRVMTPEVELSPREVAACAIEIMLNLAIQDKLNGWEYVFDAKGLRVSMKRPYGARPVSSQEELRFDEAEALAE
jgi:hypothetical protein